MMPPIGHSLMVTAMVVATSVAVTTAEDGDSDSDESLRQALVLVDILKSGILRRSHRRFAAMPNSLADSAGYRPWPPPRETLGGFNENGPPVRRMNNQIDIGPRKDNNITRQMDYEDPYGPHPGGDEPTTPEKTTEGSTSLQANNQNNDASTVATKITESTAAETKTISTDKAQSSPSSRNKSEMTKAASKKTIATKKTTKKDKLNGTPKKSGTIQSVTKIKTKKPTKLTTKSRKNLKTTPKASTKNGGGIIMLKYNKNSKTRDVIDSKKADEAEIAEAAMELQREADDIVHRRCVARRTDSKSGRTEPSGNKPQTPCVGLNCNEVNATQMTPMRYKATTRIYLSRSVRPQIPLPANNAFCYTNPENALCRTLI